MSMLVLNKETAIVFLATWDSRCTVNFEDLHSKLISKLVADCGGCTVVFVSFSEEPSQEILSIEQRFADTSTAFCHERSAVAKLLSDHRVTSVPCVVKHGVCHSLSDVYPAHEAVSDVAVAVAVAGSTTARDISVHFSEGMKAYEEFNLEGAAFEFLRVISIDSEHKSAHFNLGGLFHMTGYPTLAIPHIERVIRLDSGDTTAHSFLWSLTQSEEARAVGLEAYLRLSLAGDIRATQKLAVLTGEGALAYKGDPVYVEKVFDDLAETFEERVCSRLGYKTPWYLKDLVMQSVNSSSSSQSGSNSTVEGTAEFPPRMGDWRILDLGCGSGLCGKIFCDFVQPTSGSSSGSGSDGGNNAGCSTDYNGPSPARFNTVVCDPHTLGEVTYYQGPLMIGVDISKKMTDISRDLGCYSHVCHTDLDTTLSALSLTDTTPCTGGKIARTGFDLIIAADTFIYVGAIGSVFMQSKRCLKPKGLLAFSIEDLDRSPMNINEGSAQSPHLPVDFVDGEPQGAIPGWGARLQTSGRFAHSDRYIRVLSEEHGFRVAACQDTVIRTEETVPIPGWLYVLEST